MPAHSKSHSTPEKSPDIFFSPDIFGYRTGVSGPGNKNQPLSNGSQGQSQEQLSAGRKNPSERHVTFQEPERMREQALIHPLFRKRPRSGRAGDVTSLDHQIARHGGTTSSYEELPHRLESSKTHQPLTPGERVIELTYEKSFLLQELVYRKDTRAAEMRFLEKVTKLRAEMEAVLAELDRAMDERSRARAQAESDLCSYWGIDFGDGNVEDIVF